MSGGDDVFEPRRGSMQAHAVNGALVTGLSQLVKTPFQIASILVLPRFLDPVDYGVYAMVDPILSVVLLIQNFGISQTLVQRPSLTRPQVSALWWVMASAGVVFSALLMACSPLIAAFYHEPRAQMLAAASAFFVLYEAVINVPLGIMNRQMKFGWLAVINALAIAVGLLAGIAAAVAGLHYWALVIDYGATCLVTFIGVWLGVGWSPRARPNFRSVLPLYRFGASLMLSEAATLVTRHSDSVLIGRYAGPTQLGYYDRGNKLAAIPMQRINQLLERILLPILSRMAESPERYRRAYLRIIRQLMLFLAPGTVAVAVTAPVLIPFLLGEKWAPAAPIFALLAVAALDQPVSMTMNFLFISQGRANAFFAWSLFSAVSTVIAIAIGLRWGAVGVAGAYAVNEICVRLPVLWWWVTRRGPLRQSDLYGAAAPFAAAVLVTGAALALLQNVPFPNAFTRLAASGLAAYPIAIGVISLFQGGRMALADTRQLAVGEWRRIILRRRTT